MGLLVIDAANVRRLLPMAACIDVMRDVMADLSAGKTRQTLRQVLHLDDGRALGVMPGALGGSDLFGAKIIGVDPANRARGKQSHQGGILIFRAEDSQPLALVHAGEVTAIRTAAASAVATDALAPADAAVLAILGYGEQALAHVAAMRVVRPIREVRVWGRDAAQAQAFAARVGDGGVRAIVSADPAACVRGAQIVCTTTGADDPLLTAADIDPGTHLNVVGSSIPGPREIDDTLVARARFFGDYRPGVLAQGAEFVHARDGGVIDDAHFAGEIGAVLAGLVAGRRSRDEVTIYKSLGHVVQDLASARHVYTAARDEGFAEIPF